MRNRTIILLLACAMLFACSQSEVDEKSSGGAIDSAMNAMALSSSEGASLVKRKCASCHYLDKNLRKIGPTLKGIMGKAPASMECLLQHGPKRIWIDGLKIHGVSKRKPKWPFPVSGMSKSARQSLPI